MLVSVILLLEGDRAVVHRQQALVGEGDAMGIAAEVFQRLPGAAKRRFSVNHPFLFTQGRQIPGEGGGTGERFEFAEERQSARGESFLQG